MALARDPADGVLELNPWPRDCLLQGVPGSGRAHTDAQRPFSHSLRPLWGKGRGAEFAVACVPIHQSWFVSGLASYEAGANRSDPATNGVLDSRSNASRGSRDSRLRCAESPSTAQGASSTPPCQEGWLATISSLN